MSPADVRQSYWRMTGLFYLVWVVAFILEGLLAVTLPTRDLTLWIDRQIPVVPSFVWFYVLCYVFPLVPLLITRDWHRFNIALVSVALCTLVAFIGHVSIPVAFPRPELGGGVSDRLVRLIYENDFKPGAQNFPSLHVAIVWIITLACHRQGTHKLLEWSVLLTAALISLSTVLIKQHLVIDLIGGLVLGFSTWHLVHRYYVTRVDKGEAPLFALQRIVRSSLPAFVLGGVILVIAIGLQLSQRY